MVFFKPKKGFKKYSGILAGLLVIPLFCFLNPSGAYGGTARPGGQKAGQAEKGADDKKISMDFQNTDIRDILSLIGEVSGYNIVIADSVRGRVTVKLDQVTWEEALEVVLRSLNLGFSKSGNVLTIQDLSQLRRMQAEAYQIN